MESRRSPLWIERIFLWGSYNVQDLIRKYVYWAKLFVYMQFTCDEGLFVCTQTQHKAPNSHNPHVYNISRQNKWFIYGEMIARAGCRSTVTSDNHFCNWLLSLVPERHQETLTENDFIRSEEYQLPAWEALLTTELIWLLKVYCSQYQTVSKTLVSLHIRPID